MSLQDLLASDPQSLIDSIQQGVYVTDLDRRIVYWSKSAERITGWQSRDIVGRCCHDNTLCHVDKDNRRLCGEEFCPLHRSIVTGQGSTVPIIVFAQTPGGSRVPMRVSVAPIRDAAGKIIGGVETFQDLTSEFADMQRGRRIQAASMANDAAGDPRLDVQVHYAPHDIIGGDYYSFSRLDDDHYGFLLADVSGHGLSAALYTMHLGSLWDDHKQLVRQPAEFARVVNQRLHLLLHDAASFATALCGVVDVPARTIDLASAGGPSPLVCRAHGAYEPTDITGCPLGFVDDADFGQLRLDLQPGDRVLLFSDGLLEISKADGEQVGEQGLADLLHEMGYPGQDIRFGELENRLLASSDRIRFDDDLTIAEVRFPGAV